MKPLGVHHVSVNVSDVPKSVAFYADVLGGSVREATVPPNVGQHFAIRVADLDAVVAELRSKGFTVGDPFDVVSDRQTTVADPDGNVVELHEVGVATS